jgi:hypothetical protein
MMMVIGLLLLLGGGGIWMYRMGGAKAKLAQAEADVEKLGELNKMGVEHETETDDIFAALAAADKPRDNGPPKLPRDNS